MFNSDSRDRKQTFFCLFFTLKHVTLIMLTLCYTYKYDPENEHNTAHFKCNQKTRKRPMTNKHLASVTRL